MTRRLFHGHGVTPVTRMPLDYSVTLEAVRRRRQRWELVGSGICFAASLAVLFCYVVMFG